MDRNEQARHYRFVKNISASGLSIYDKIPVGDPDLWIPTESLEFILDNELKGVSLAGLKLRTRSKHLKARICRALGYPIPQSFKRRKPRFVGQLFDSYGQKSNNLQIWNEDIDLQRRYVIAAINEADVITECGQFWAKNYKITIRQEHLHKNTKLSLLLKNRWSW